MHLKHIVVDTFESVEEKCVSVAVKDGTEISKVLSFPLVVLKVS